MSDCQILRLVDNAAAIHEGQDRDAIAFHHSVFCQTGLPYRYVPDRVWERTNGFVSLRVEAGVMLHPSLRTWVELPIPHGTKSRLILIYLDTQAKINNSPKVEIGSMTGFFRQLLGYTPSGKELSTFKNHTTALIAATFRLGMTDGEHAIQVNRQIASGWQLWSPKDQHETFWPNFIQLSDEYFSTLQAHAIPLDCRAVRALQNSALGLDIYKWLAQRLCRVPTSKPTFIPWPTAQFQFGQHYARLRAFRSNFIKTLRVVLTQYPKANIQVNENGILLRESAPPIPKLG